MRLLSPDEHERADRFLVSDPRDRFLVARGTLRELLGRASGLAPEQLRFSYPCVCGRANCPPSRRKPQLELPAGRPRLSFNLAHTEGLAIFAVSAGREVGVDLERIGRLEEIGPVARRAFGERELAELWALPEAQQAEAFYRGWTRKEAFTKALGSGFDLPPADVGIPLAPGEATVLRRVGNGDAKLGSWRLYDVPSPSGYVASLAAEGSDWVLLTDWWPPGD